MNKPLTSSHDQAKNQGLSTDNRFKVCPVCQARCFSDMEVCYGCLYHFPDEPQASLQSSVPETTPSLSQISENRLVENRSGEQPLLLNLQPSSMVESDASHKLTSDTAKNFSDVSVREPENSSSDSAVNIEQHESSQGVEITITLRYPSIVAEAS